MLEKSAGEASHWQLKPAQQGKNAMGEAPPSAIALKNSLQRLFWSGS
ncbi:hypothetical protein H6G81_01545 [Scytonema hofmannii FACHB-248]|uniref:Uncharacterized protein n=1 Tax=Scytonema hofmannii FACHB-248 TaxID=1842502 RepID=A0ABR8GJ81_9CYAN|nr:MULTISPECIES: hypothetical protein [Nostocales]MBD2603239.1 hypothetical protein [Scytonema hofmannii FACHB-248]